MKLCTAQWGNSLAVRIPKIFATKLQLTPQTEIEITLVNNELHIRKPMQKLDMLLAQVNKENMHMETDTGDITGKEIW